MGQRRRLRLLLPDPTGQTILTDRNGLPSLDIELEVGETTSAGAWRLLPTIGLAGPLVDCYVDQSNESGDADGAIVGVLVELAAPLAGWVPPAGWVSTALATAAPTIEPGLAPVLDERLAELRGDRPIAELRIPWGRPGWYERARSWIEQVLHDAGHAPPTAVIQSRHWGISAVMEVDTPGGRFWFKAPFGPFRREATITKLLYEARPKQIAPMIAIDEDEGWMLLADIPGRVLGEDRALTRAAFESLAAVQSGLVGHVADLRAAGCPHRPIGDLPIELRRALTTPLMHSVLDLSVQRVDQLIDSLSAAVADVEQVGVPDSFVHGDFHPGNVINAADGIWLFDWSDAAITNPLVDIATWTSWFEDDPEHVDAIYRTFHHVRAVELRHEPGTELDRLDRGTLAAVAGAYHTISYAGILEALEPHRQAEHIGGIGEYFSLLDSATPR